MKRSRLDPFESTLYVLELHGGRFYVGITGKSAKERFREHLGGARGAAWTKIHRPIRILEHRRVLSEHAAAEETKRTCEFMLLHGVNNVRGGPWTQTKPFDECDLEHLISSIGHHLGMDYKDVRRMLQEDDEEEESSGSDECLCSRCGRDSHVEEQCYARTDVDGEEI